MTIPSPQLPVTEYVEQVLNSAGLLDGWRVDLEFFDDSNDKEKAITLVSRGGSSNIELDTQIVEIIATGEKPGSSDSSGHIREPRQHLESIKSFLIPARNIAIDVPIFHFNVIGSIMPFSQLKDGRKAFVMNVECLTTRSE